MENEIKEIKNKLEKFIKEYGFSIEVQTVSISKDFEGIASGKVQITLQN